MNNLYFLAKDVPTVGPAATQCEARAEIRGNDGKVLCWHCLLTPIQYAHHSRATGLPFNKAPVGTSKRLNYLSAATAQMVTKDCPTHQFAGHQIDDQETKKLIICDKVDDEDLAKPVAVQAPGMVDSERG